MAWTNPSDHGATVVSVTEWNNFHGAAGNCAHLKALADAPMKAQGNGGSVCGGRAKLNFIAGANVTVTVADAAGDDRVNITLAASGGTTPTQSQSSGPISVVTNSTHNIKGAWQEAIASAGFTVTGIMATLASISLESLSYDIGVGAAGAEAVKVADLLMMGAGNGAYGGHPSYIPFSIASGSRIAVRAADVTSDFTRTVTVNLVLLG